MRRLAAFTILEVTVAMAITAVVVLLSFGGFRLVQAQFRQFNDQQLLSENYRRCLTLLKMDAHRCRYVQQLGQELWFYSPKDTVSYRISDQMTIREYGLQHRDTFVVNLEITRSISVPDTRGGLANECVLTVKMTDFAKTFYLHKRYSAEELLLWENEY